MASIPMFDPLSTEIRSPLIAGLTEACNKLSTVLDLGVSEFVDLPLTPVDSNLMIYQTPLGNKLWMKSPTPIIKKNGKEVTEVTGGFTINYVGGSIEFDTGAQPSELDTLTASAHYIVGNSNVIEDILEDISKLTGAVDSYKGAYPDLDSLEEAYPSGKPGDYAIVSDVDGAMFYLWNDRTRKWEPASTEVNLSNYYTKDETDVLLDEKENLIPSPTHDEGSKDEDYYYNGAKQWAKFSDSIQDIPLSSIDPSAEGEITPDDTLGEALGKLQNQINENKLDFDDAPTPESKNPVTSDGIYNAIQEIGPKKIFVAVCSTGDIRSLSSVDAKNWDTSTMPSILGFQSLTYGNGMFVAVAEESDKAAWSTDGKNWLGTTLPSSGTWKSVTYGDGMFVAVKHGSNSAAWSTDGKTWTASTLPSSTNWYSVTYGGGMFVAIATNGYVAYSTDGIEWTGARNAISSAYWYCLSYGDGLFVAVSNDSNKAAWSTDGINWTESTLPYSTKWRSVTYGNGMFVTVSSDNTDKSAWSTDGINWTGSTMPSVANWESVTYGNGMFVSVTYRSNKVAWSTDGKNWSELTLPFSYGPYCTSIAYGEITKPYYIPTGGTTGQVLTKKSYDDYDVEWTDGGTGSSAIQATVTLDTSDWSDSTPSTKTVTVEGVLEDTTKQNIMIAPFPDVTNVDTIASYSIFCTGQGDNSLTFTAINGAPEEQTVFNVSIQNL